MSRSAVTRMLVGTFLAPENVAPGERVPVNAWLVRHPDATVLVDTGLTEHPPPEDVTELRFTRLPIAEALAGIGVRPEEVDLVVNCNCTPITPGATCPSAGRRSSSSPPSSRRLARRATR